jgi:hypothetical protein
MYLRKSAKINLIRKSQIPKLPFLRKVRKLEKIRKFADLRFEELVADRPPVFNCKADLERIALVASLCNNATIHSGHLRHAVLTSLTFHIQNGPYTVYTLVH